MGKRGKRKVKSCDSPRTTPAKNVGALFCPETTVRDLYEGNLSEVKKVVKELLQRESFSSGTFLLDFFINTLYINQDTHSKANLTIKNPMNLATIPEDVTDAIIKQIRDS